MRTVESLATRHHYHYMIVLTPVQQRCVCRRLLELAVCGYALCVAVGCRCHDIRKVPLVCCWFVLRTRESVQLTKEEHRQFWPCLPAGTHDPRTTDFTSEHSQPRKSVTSVLTFCLQMLLVSGLLIANQLCSLCMGAWRFKLTRFDLSYAPSVSYYALFLCRCHSNCQCAN